MAGVAGVELVYAFKKGVTWNTPIVLGAGNGFLSKPSGIKEAAGLSLDDSLGLFFTADGTPTDVKVDGDLPLYLRYDGLDTLLAMVFGTPGAITPVVVNGTGYKYTLKPQKQTDGLFVTFAKYMKNYISEVASLKIIGFTIKGEAGKPVEISFKTIGSMINKNTGAGTNTTTTFNSVTIPTKALADRLMFAQAQFLINDQSAVALVAPTDQVYPSAFELTVERNLSGVLGSYNTGGANPRDVIDEPSNDGVPTIGLKLTFPRHSANTRLNELGLNTKKKASIVFTGSTIVGSTAPRKFTFTFSHLQYKDVPVTDAQGIIQEPVEFVCHAASAAPAGMIGQTDPLWLEIQNQQTTDPLA